MRWMNSKAVKPALFMLMLSMSEALAQVGVGAPEIDGPAGVTAIALLVGAGIIAYNRYRKK